MHEETKGFNFTIPEVKIFLEKIGRKIGRKNLTIIFIIVAIVSAGYVGFSHQAYLQSPEYRGQVWLEKKGYAKEISDLHYEFANGKSDKSLTEIVDERKTVVAKAKIEAEAEGLDFELIGGYWYQGRIYSPDNGLTMNDPVLKIYSSP